MARLGGSTVRSSQRLTAPGSAQPMGVALARLLVTDPASPLRVESEPGTLYAMVRLATAAMGPLLDPRNAGR